jgi:hypothetical protein
MIIDDISVEDLEKLAIETESQLEKIQNPDVKNYVLKMISRFNEMIVALTEIEHLENEFHRGNITSEVYFDRHKKLVYDFYSARNTIPDEIIPKIENFAEGAGQKSKLEKFKNYLKSNKDFILNVSQLVLTILQIFGK